MTDGPTPPIAPKRPTARTVHGIRLEDEYAWLRERDSDDVRAHLEAENAYTDAVLESLAPLRETLFAEMRGRIQETDTSESTLVDGYEYFDRTEEGAAYTIHCRRTPGREEQILLDPNAIADEDGYLRVGALDVSDDHRLLAYSLDEDGSELFTLRVREIATGVERDVSIPGTSPHVAWSNDGRHLFYVGIDPTTRRPRTVRRHALGDDPAHDVVVHDEDDERFHVSVHKTRSRRFVVIEIESAITTEIRLIDADDPDGASSVVRPREHGIEYEIDHAGDHLYVLTNHDARNFRVLRAPLARFDDETTWQEIVPHDPAVMIEHVDLFADHMVLTLRRDAVRRVKVFDLSTLTGREVPFDEPVYTAGLAWNPNFDTRTLRVRYTSLTTPRSVYDVDVDTLEATLVRRTPVLGGYDPERYETLRIWAAAPDGARVPISLVRRRDLDATTPQPCLLYGYGSYGITIDPGFSSARLSLLDRGVVFAIAHVRGGGALGRGWYEAGKFLDKPNTFSDFVAAAEALVAERVSAPDRLVIEGGSAGGLLMGAVLNARPELFRAAIAKVPFVDVVNTMLDPSLPLTVIEYDEWGDPSDPRFFEAMRAYSPYDNVRDQRYPDLLVTAGLNDPRVQYWEPAKWVAKLRATRSDDGLVLLRMHMGAGHAGRSGRYAWLEETGFEYAFLLDRLGLAETAPRA